METVLQKVFPAMGTIHTFTLYEKNRLALANQMKAELLRLDAAWSIFRTDSELSRMNRSAGIEPVSVCADTLRVLQTCKLFSISTGGAFDVTAGALAAIWRKAIQSGVLPTESEIEAAKSLTDAQSIRCNEADGTAFLPHVGQTIDFGGVAKGYAMDRLLQILHENKVNKALLNLGGTVAAIGDPVPIGIRNPFAPNGKPVGTLNLMNRCAVTSGFYERYVNIGGRRYHHIVDPRTGYPSNSGLASVTLVGINGTALDALATAVFILGINQSLPILQSRGIDAVFITDEGEVLVTEPIRTDFHLCAA